jgi:A118 family predicted phage portal protein
MFSKILEWIRDRINNMLNTSNVSSALHVDIAISPLMTAALQKWALMYINQAGWLTDEIKSLGLPAAIAGELARAATIEMDVEISGNKISQRAKYKSANTRAAWLYEQIDRVYPKLREQVEYGVAKGGLMLKPYPVGKNIAVDYVQADCFYPVSFDANGKITACIFSDTRIIGKYYYTRLEFHQMDGNVCWITNAAFKADGPNALGRPCPLTEVADWAELQEERGIENVEKLLVGYFRNPGANNIDPTSPLGVSGYSRAVELIQQADTLWANLIWEFKSGKRRMYVNEDAFDKGADGKPKLPDVDFYRIINSQSDVGTGGKLFEAWTPEFRNAAIQSGLDAILKKIEFNCGLAYGTISDPNTVDKTATEIIASKQRSAATVVDTQKALENALEDLLYAMDVWATLGGLAPAGPYEAAYAFDDSIVTDHITQFAQDSQALGLQVMSKVKFLMRNYGLTEEMARQEIADIQAENAGGTDLFGVPADPNAQDQTKEPAVGV